MPQENNLLDTMFVFVTGEGRIMARLTDGSVRDVTELCDLLPRDVCAKTKARDAENTAPLALAA